MPLYELSVEAEQDWRNIVRYTFDQHGETQVRKYMNSLIKCIDGLIVIGSFAGMSTLLKMI